MLKLDKFIDEMRWSVDYKNVILELIHGSESFNELQSNFIEWGGLEKNKVLVSAPTASGKTLLGILGILNKLHKGENSFIYLVPYNSIRDEKFEELNDKFKKINISVKKGYKGLKELKDGKVNIVVSDFSAFDKYSRENPDFELASFYIFDEIDVLGSLFFGPSIEGSIARLLRKGDFDLLAISATIPESNRLCEWFDAEFFKSEYKPVKHEEEVKVVEDFHEEICNLYLKDKRTKDKSVLIMIYDKRRVMSYAKNIANILSEYGIKSLENDNQMIVDVLGRNPHTKTNKALIESLKYRVAFHHADLHNTIKNKIIGYYNVDEIKIIVCTPTLLRGVNLKTRTVILPDTFIYIKELNRRIPMPYVDYLQFKGRAGRPPYEDKAYVIIFAKNDRAKKQLEKLYLTGTIKSLKSGFIDFKNRIVYPLLDKQILIEIFNEPKKMDDLIEIFSNYFFAVGVPNLSSISNRLNKRIELLENKKLVEKNIYEELTTSLHGDDYLRNYESKNITIEDYDKLVNLSIKILTDQISFDERFHFKILNELLGILGSKNFIKIEKRGENKEHIEEEMRKILKLKCGIHTETINSHHITLVCLIEHLSHTSLESIDERFGVDSTRLESVLKNVLDLYLDSLINIITFLIDNLSEIYYDEEIEQGEDFLDLSAEKILEMLEYLKLRIRYGVKFELIPIITLQNIGNFRGISLYNAINNRFRDADQLSWEILKTIEGEFLKSDITGWDKLKKKLFEELEGILSIEKRLKKTLELFNIKYNIRELK